MSESQFAILSSKFLKIKKKDILSLIQGLQNTLKKDVLFFLVQRVHIRPSVTLHNMLLKSCE